MLDDLGDVARECLLVLLERLVEVLDGDALEALALAHALQRIALLLGEVGLLLVGDHRVDHDLRGPQVVDDDDALLRADLVGRKAHGGLGVLLEGVEEVLDDVFVFGRCLLRFDLELFFIRDDVFNHLSDLSCRLSIARTRIPACGRHPVLDFRALLVGTREPVGNGRDEVLRVQGGGVGKRRDAGQVTGHLARLDGGDGRLLELVRELFQLGRAVELPALS